MGSNPSYNHPAYYFHCAGTYAVKRRKKSAIAIKVVKPELLEKYKDLPSLHLASVDLSKQQYVGQLPHERSEYDDSNSLGYEEWVLARRAIREHNVPHSRKILELLQRVCINITVDLIRILKCGWHPPIGSHAILHPSDFRGLRIYLPTDQTLPYL